MHTVELSRTIESGTVEIAIQIRAVDGLEEANEVIASLGINEVDALMSGVDELMRVCDAHVEEAVEDYKRAIAARHPEAKFEVVRKDPRAAS